VQLRQIDFLLIVMHLFIPQQPSHTTWTAMQGILKLTMMNISRRCSQVRSAVPSAVQMPQENPQSPGLNDLSSKLQAQSLSSHFVAIFLNWVFERFWFKVFLKCLPRWASVFTRVNQCQASRLTLDFVTRPRKTCTLPICIADTICWSKDRGSIDEGCRALSVRIIPLSFSGTALCHCNRRLPPAPDPFRYLITTGILFRTAV
jgi:hypothetical protein